MKRDAFNGAGEVKLGRQYRTAVFVRESVNEADRTVELSFSSENPVERWYGFEILDHGAGADFSFIASGRAPFLVDHNYRDQIGVIDWAKNDGGTGRAKVRFSTSDRATQFMNDIRDGIRPNTSVGYEVGRMQLEAVDDTNGDTFRVISWRPFEISSVAIPADETVGVGRAAEDTEAQFSATTVDYPKGVRGKPMANEQQQQQETTVETRGAPVDVAEVRKGAAAEAIAAERKRVNDIEQLAAITNTRDLAAASIKAGDSFERFKGIVYEKRAGEEAPLGKPATEVGLSTREIGNYSFFRAIEAVVSGNRKGAEVELEASDEIAKRLGKGARGFYVPFEVMSRGFLQPEGLAIAARLRAAGLSDAEATRVAQDVRGMQQQRALNVGTLGQGGALVAMEHRPDAFIELLRNKALVMGLGARALPGLVGNVDIPKQSGGATAFWIGEGANTTASAPGFGQVILTPRTISGRVDITRRLMNQSTPAAEALVRDDLLNVLAIEIDRAAINGNGVGGQPIGILNTAGVAVTALGTNGAVPTWAAIVDQETQVALNNADIGNLAYLTTIKARGKLKVTDKTTGGYGQFLWTEGNTLNGYSAFATNNVPSNLTKGSGSNLSASIFGNWTDILIGEWGVLDIQAEKITLADSGGVTIRAFQDLDIELRRGGSFDAIVDMITV